MIATSYRTRTTKKFINFLTNKNGILHNKLRKTVNCEKRQITKIEINNGGSSLRFTDIHGKSSTDLWNKKSRDYGII